MKNMIGGEIRQLSMAEYLALFDESVHGAIKARFEMSGVHGSICCENLQMDSSAFGAKTAMIYGPGCTFNSLRHAAINVRLGTVPSVFQYPVAYYTKEDAS